VKTVLLQLGQRASGTWNWDGAVHQMVGEFRGKRGMRELVRVDVEFDEGSACSQMALWQDMKTTSRRISH
jgi:hypothetical protein